MIDEKTKERINKVLPFLNESQKRIYLAAEAYSIGRGGVTQISQFTGVSRSTIKKGMDGTTSHIELTNHRIRKKGAGRKTLEYEKPEIIDELRKLLKPSVSHETVGPLIWTIHSAITLSETLHRKGYEISHVQLRNLLEKLGFDFFYKTGKKNDAERLLYNSQFMFINEFSAKFLEDDSPVIYVQCRSLGYQNIELTAYKEKDLDFELMIGHLHSNTSVPVYGACFVASAIRHWWFEVGKHRFNNAAKIYVVITLKMMYNDDKTTWNRDLRKLAKETGLTIFVSHLPSGAYKWGQKERDMVVRTDKAFFEELREYQETVISTVSCTGKKIPPLKLYKDIRYISDEEKRKTMQIAKLFQNNNHNYYFKP